MKILFWPFAVALAALHCLIRHGAGPMRTEYHGRFVLMCPACGCIFWRGRR